MGVVGNEGGVATDLAPQLAVIEETTSELKQRYVSYEEAKRQLDFLEKGGDPLDFRAGNAVSLSFQSTSLTDQHPEQLLTSKVQDSLAVAASRPGDSVESSGRPQAPPANELNCDDNLMLFDGHNDFLKGEKNSIHSPWRIIGPSEKYSQLDGIENHKESGDSAAFGLPRKAYRRRNRSRSSRDGTRSSSTEVVSSCGVHASLPSQNALGDAKRLTIEGDNQKDYDVSLKSILKSTSANYIIAPKDETPDRYEVDDSVQSLHSNVDRTRGGLLDAKIDANASNSLLDNRHNQFSESDSWITPINMAPDKLESSQKVSKRVALAGHKCASSLVTPKVIDQVTFGQMNGLSSEKGDKMSTLNDHENGNAVPGTRGLDSESSCNQTSLSIDGNLDNEICTNLRTGGSNGNGNEEIVAFEDTPNKECNTSVKETNEPKTEDMCDVTIDGNDSFHKVHQDNGSISRNEQALKEKVPGSLIEMKDQIPTVGMVPDAFNAPENEKNPNSVLDSSSIGENGNACTARLQETSDSFRENLDTKLSTMVSAVSPELQTCSHVTSKLATKKHEDSILEEARMIEAKCKRITDLSVRTLLLEDRSKSHWEFVLEEMAWLANDFAQERIWKISAAAQIGYQASSASRLKFHEQKSCRKQKEVAHYLAEAVVNFWRCIKETNKDQNLHKPGKDFSYSVQGYALKFLKDNTSSVQPAQAESPVTPDRISDHGILDMSWETHLTEENLFYSVPTGAMEAYRKSIESHSLQFEKTSSMQEEVETSCYDTLPELGFQEFKKEEGETNTYYLPGAFEGSKSTKFAQKKRKHLMKAFRARSYELGSDNKVGNIQSVMIGKRCASTLNVSIPTKRLRTASRQRVLSHFDAGASGCVQAPIKTDTSSGDTNSFQDDQSTSQGRLHTQNSLEVESLRDFDKQILYDSAEISHKPKKKKKAKTMGSTYEQRWHMNPNYRNEQKGNIKRSLDIHQFESNGSNGLYIQQVLKKPKMMKQLLDNSVNNLNHAGGSVPSPVASQMSNMSNPNKAIKMLGGRERGRKAKTLKAPDGQSGLESSWSLFEDQALVVLVHDMGPNWEFVSDALSSTLQFKCIFRKPKDCKERHKILMDIPSGDGADSAEDSGPSQPYQSTLPGIPKGSARQLYQCLQGPMEEATIKSHLDKIIILGKKQHCRIQEPKQFQLPHNSHTLALSQVCPNNMNGDPVLTPLDLCDATTSSPDVLSFGYQSPHNGLLPVSNQGNVAPMLPASGATPSVQVSSNVALDSNFSSHGPLNASVRDGRSGIPRSASLSVDEQQQIQQYNQLLSGRNIQQPSMPVPGVHSDRGVRILTSANGVGNVSGLNRSIQMARPGVQGIASSMLNSGSMLSSGMVAMPKPVNIQSGPFTGPINSMTRPCDPLHMMRPTQDPDHQRRMMIPDLQMQVSQGNSNGVSPFGGLRSSPNQTKTPGQSYPHPPHPMSSQQSHALTNSHFSHLQGKNQTSNTHHQAYASCFAKEKHIQPQRSLLQHQQQQYAASSALMPVVQGQSQLPLSSQQNTSQVQPQISPPVSLSPLMVSSSVSPNSQHPHKHQMPPHGADRNPQVGGSGLTNQMGKQRQRQTQQQQFQQTGRHHPQQRQQSQYQQPAKTLKGIGRGNIMMHQNLPKEQALVNGLSTASGGQSGEKGEQGLLTTQGQGLYPGSVVNYIHSPNHLVPRTSYQSLPQQKLYSGQSNPHSNPDNSNQNHVVSTLATTVQAAGPPGVPTSKKQQSLLQHQAQPQLHAKPSSSVVDVKLEKILDQNCQVNSDPPKKLQDIKSQSDPSPVTNNSSQISTSASVLGSVDTANVNSVVSSDVTQWKAPEMSDSHVPNQAAEFGSIGSPPLTNTGSEPLPFASQGLVQRQSSGSLPPVQWLKKQSQLQPSILLPPFKQQQESQKQQAQQETELLREGSNSLHVSPTQL